MERYELHYIPESAEYFQKLYSLWYEVQEQAHLEKDVYKNQKSLSEFITQNM